MEKVGKDGVITVEEGKTAETTYEVVEGMQFDKGYLSPYFINRAAEMDCLLEDACILIHEKKISNLRDLIPLLEKISHSGKPLLIIAEDVEGEALATLVVNKLRGVLNDLRGEGPRLRRSPQGDARRHRRPHRRHADQRGPGPEAGEPHARPARPGASRSPSTRTHHDRRGRRQAGRRSRAASTSSEAADRDDRQRLRPREVPGAAGQAVPAAWR